MDFETIAAMATPTGVSGIGIIRLSGSRAVSIADHLFSPGSLSASGGKIRLADIPSHLLCYGHIVDGEHRQVVDEVMVVVMRAPRSYTREDVVEIQAHCGHVIMSKILDLVLKRGARLADPGEFTRRAFLNGRIDLSQAEAVVDLLSARSESALQLAATHLTGQLRLAVERLIEVVENLRVELEARIEFPEETGEGTDLKKVGDLLRSDVLGPIQEMIVHYREGKLLRNGVRLGIVGRPNVGKSSLLNTLLRKERAIVTTIPGTTRDLIEDQTCIEGVPVVLMDTAGLRQSTDPIEILGIQKTRESIDEADIILFVVDGSRPCVSEDMEAYEYVRARKVILCINKIDLISDETDGDLPGELHHLPCVRISAKKGWGIDELKSAIKERCLLDAKIEPGGTIVPNRRQKACLDRAEGACVQALQTIDRGYGEELVVSDLSEIMKALLQIVGRDAGGDVLDEIFNRFCIGK